MNEWDEGGRGRRELRTHRLQYGLRKRCGFQRRSGRGLCCQVVGRIVRWRTLHVQLHGWARRQRQTQSLPACCGRRDGQFVSVYQTECGELVQQPFRHQRGVGTLRIKRLQPRQRRRPRSAAAQRLGCERKARGRRARPSRREWRPLPPPPLEAWSICWVCGWTWCGRAI